MFALGKKANVRNLWGQLKIVWEKEPFTASVILCSRIIVVFFIIELERLCADCSITISTTSLPEFLLT